MSGMSKELEVEQEERRKSLLEAKRKEKFMFCAVWCSAFKPCETGPCPHGLPEGLVKRNERG